jgi:hypothetical protein
MRLQDYLISARFLTTMGHLTALVLIFSTIENNIQRALPDVQYQINTEYDDAYTSAMVSLCYDYIFDYLFNIF